jgi:hypothetical protein
MQAANESAVRVFARGSTAGEPIVFVGEPSLLEADLWLHNEGDGDLLLDKATVISPALQKDAPRSEVARISVPRVLRARQRTLLSTSFDIDPSIPPGTYEAEIRLHRESGHESFLAWITVTQNYQLSLDPDQFVFAATPGSSVSAELVVWNEGNVPVEVTPMGECELKDPDRVEPCPCCCAREERREKEEDEFGRVRITNDNLVVEPGAWASVKFTVHLPESLPANAQLRARPRVGNERFNIDILTPAQPGHGKKHRSGKSKAES